MSSAFDRLRAHDAGLRGIFPKHVVGELPVTEEYFRDILGELREYGSLRTPPRHFPRLMIALVFTARYDYKGAFWKAFQENVGLGEVDTTAWGSFFRKCVADFGLFSPPEHWMVNVFPVLYHAIIPESSKGDFGIMVRSLIDAVDVRDLDDEGLLAAVRSYDLPTSLHAFITSDDSAPVACDLIRQVSEDFRQLTLTERSEIDEESFRGALLSSVANASIAQRTRFTLRERLLVWRWDLGSGELGAYFTGNVTFDEAPLRLRLGSNSYELDCFRDYDGRWAISGRLVPISLSHAGETGAIEFASGVKETIRLTRAGDLPLFFKASGDSGTLTSSADIEAGTYAIASSQPIRVRERDEEVQPLEHLPAPNVAGVRYAALYDLSQHQKVEVGDARIIVRGRMRPAATISQTSAWTLLSDRSDQVPIYAASPRVRFESPICGSSYRFINRTANSVVAEATFEGKESLRLDLPEGSIYRATIQVDGKASGASAVDFAVLPIRSLNKDASGFAIVGNGLLTVSEHGIQLSDIPTTIAPEILLSPEPIRYEYRGSSFRIQYVGPRPTMWRLGAGAFSQSLLQCDTGDVLTGRPIEFRGTPGASISLADSTGRVRHETIGLDGLLEVSLSNFGGDYDRVDIKLVESEQQLPCATVFGAPLAAFVSVGLEAGSHGQFSVGGQLALDRNVDRAYLTLRRNRQPWFKPLEYELEGFARSWKVHCEPQPAEYVLTLDAELDGRRIPILDRDGVWTRVCGQQHSKLDHIDAALDDALSGRSDAIPYLVNHASTRRRTINLCVDALEVDFDKFHRATERIFSAVGRHITVAELSELGRLTCRTENRICRVAAIAGLPVAAAPQRATVIPGEFQSISLKDLLELDFLSFLANIAGNASSVAQAAEVIDRFADDPEENATRRSYAGLLRITLATDLYSEIDRLRNEMDGPAIHRARLEAMDLIEHSGFPLFAICELDSVRSLFSKCISAVWSFAFASRLCQWLPSATPVPTASLLLSRWLYDRAIGPISRLALISAEAICSEMHERNLPKTC